MSDKKKSLLSWIFAFAGTKKAAYFLSVFFALLCVACAIAPYILIADIVKKLLSGTREWSVYFNECLAIAAFWVGNALFHMISTSLSHIATFNVLANIRKNLCDKLSRVPLGSVLDMPSGSLKSILIERIDSMETTLAHILPEWTSNLVLPILMFAWLFHLDWRMGLASLATLPVGIISASFMMVNMTERFQNAIENGFDVYSATALWSRRWDSNPRPGHYRCPALSTELLRQTRLKESNLQLSPAGSFAVNLTPRN